MGLMQDILRKQDIFWWVDCYLRSALGAVPDEFRSHAEYVPLAADESLIEV
jgi:hypothetical protein